MGVARRQLATATTRRRCDYVRRTGCSARVAVKGDAAISASRTRENTRVDPGVFEFVSAMRAGWFACESPPLTNVLGLRTVKSFAALSVSDNSSGNSAATMPHNSRDTTARASNVPIFIRADDIIPPVGELIHRLSDNGKWQLLPRLGGGTRRVEREGTKAAEAGRRLRGVRGSEARCAGWTSLGRCATE